MANQYKNSFELKETQSPRVFLDSNVILSTLPRAIAFFLAKRGDILLCYSHSVEEETRHVASRKGLNEDIASAFVTLRLLAGDPVEGLEDEGLWLKDENDRHVVLGARAAKAEILLTENLRDFPKAVLAPFGIKALSPDQLFAPMLDAEMLKALGADHNSLKRAKLYRSAKHLASSNSEITS